VEKKIYFCKSCSRKTGRKKELLDRVEYYDRNDDFCAGPAISIPVANPMPAWPPISDFRTMTASDREEVPVVLPAHIEHYVLHRQVQSRLILVAYLYHVNQESCFRFMTGPQTQMLAL
jgi:hypothetical protein